MTSSTRWRRPPIARRHSVSRRSIRSDGGESNLPSRALAEDATHVEANILLAESTRHAERRIELFRNAKEMAMAQLGSMMDEEVGHFWGITETRPFMRATHGLADALYDAGQTHEAIAQYQELLRFNPNDNQGVRYQLTPLLLANNREAEAVELLDRYREPTARGTT